MKNLLSNDTKFSFLRIFSGFTPFFQLYLPDYIIRGGSRAWQGEGHKQANGWGDPVSLVSSCIFEVANNTPLSSISLLIFTILAFADDCEVIKAV